jgi:hypothetical protein
MRKSVILKALFSLVVISNVSLAQDFDGPPPPPPPASTDSKPLKKLSNEEVIEEVRSKSSNLKNTSIGRLMFNWPDADLWVLQNLKNSLTETNAFFWYMNGSKRFKSDSLGGDLTIKIIDSPLMIKSDEQQFMMKNTMEGLYPSSNFSVLFKNSFVKENRLIFKVERIPVGDDYFKSLMSQIIQVGGKVAIITYFINNEIIPEHIEKMWIDRFKNLNFKE